KRTPRPSPDQVTFRLRRASRGWTTFRRRAAGSPGTNWRRRAGPDPSASATGSRSSPTVRSSRLRRPSAGSTSSSAAAWRRPWRSRPNTRSHGRGRSRSGHSGGPNGAPRVSFTAKSLLTFRRLAPSARYIGEDLHDELRARGGCRRPRGDELVRFRDVAQAIQIERPELHREYALALRVDL